MGNFLETLRNSFKREFIFNMLKHSDTDEDIDQVMKHDFMKKNKYRLYIGGFKIFFSVLLALFFLATGKFETFLRSLVIVAFHIFTVVSSKLNKEDRRYHNWFVFLDTVFLSFNLIIISPKNDFLFLFAFLINNFSLALNLLM